MTITFKDIKNFSDYLDQNRQPNMNKTITAQKLSSGNWTATKNVSVSLIDYESTMAGDPEVDNIEQGYRYHIKLTFIISLLDMLIPLVNTYMAVDVYHTLKAIRKRAYTVRNRNVRKYRRRLPNSSNIGREYDIDKIDTQIFALEKAHVMIDAEATRFLSPAETLKGKAVAVRALIRVATARKHLLESLGGDSE